MRISEARAVDVRGPLTAQRRRLLDLLTSLSDAQWAAPTAAPQWSVKDIALHLLDVDLSWLARNRDHDQTGIIPIPSGHEEFVRGLAERWVHYRQIAEAARPAGHDQYLPLVLRTFIWGFPHQYQAPAPAGTAIALEIPGIGAWVLTKTATGWSLDEGQAAAPAAGLRISGEVAWRLLTGTRYDARQVQLSGDPALAQPLLQVRGIIV
jgi:mycothiol maleylpyruvate isomerase-like protein